MRYLSPIDPHVHLRWGEQPLHPFPAWGLQDAKQAGLAGLIEMPNTIPHLVDATTVQARALYMHEVARQVKYRGNLRLLMGATMRTDCTDNAVCMEMSGQFGTCGIKAYFAATTGTLLIRRQDWLLFWNTLVKMNYQGVVTMHCEEENDPKGFDPRDPRTHSLARSAEGEAACFAEQISLADQAGFRGKMVAAHCSSAQMVEAAFKTPRTSDFSIYLEATWHHLFLNEEDYKIHGNRVKMNPPLRSRKQQEELLECALAGKIDFIGSDHAPHPVAAKDTLKDPASGIPTLPFWPCGIRKLKDAGMNDAGIDTITVYNARNVYGLGSVHCKEVEAEYDPSRWEKYGWNPFSRVDREY
jgi:dihydroorotase